MENTNPLGTMKISTLLKKFSVPAIIGMVVNALYNIVDRIYIGNAPGLGKNGLAGITIGFPIMIILLSIGILFGIGGATLFSIRLGEGKPKEADRAIGNSFMLLVISGAIFMVLGQIFLNPLLKLFGADEEILPYSVSYMRWIFFGAIFQVVSIGMNNFLRADGQPKLAMVTMFAGAGTNIILDPIFIYVFDMGMAGAAIATIIAQALSMVWILIYFLGKRTNHKLKLKHMKLSAKFSLKIVSLGLPLFLMQLANSVLNVILNKRLYIYGGVVAVSSMGIVNSVQTILLMPITGLNQGVQPIVSFNFGARKYGRIKEVEKLAITIATLIVLAGWIATRLFPGAIVSLFNRETDLVEVGSYALVTWFWCLPLIGFQILAANFFQAIGRSTVAMLLILTRQVLLLIPAIILFSNKWGLEGVLYAAPFADGIATVLTGICFAIGMSRLELIKPVSDTLPVLQDTI